jgi:hypothetical protein
VEEKEGREDKKEVEEGEGTAGARRTMSRVG